MNMKKGKEKKRRKIEKKEGKCNIKGNLKLKG
jgi:hypothetical protein